MRPSHHSNYVSASESPASSSSRCFLARLFLCLSPSIRGWNYLSLHTTSFVVFLLCVFLLPHWENASRLLNYRSQVACQQQKWFNTPLKIHLAVLTMNISKAASSGPPKRERTEQPSHTCFWTTGRSVQPFILFLHLSVLLWCSILILIRRIWCHASLSCHFLACLSNYGCLGGFWLQKEAKVSIYNL